MGREARSSEDDRQAATMLRCEAMWIPDKDKLVKIRLHAEGEDVETPWAEDLGPADGRPGSRLVRLGNIPFLHAKPTYGDVIVVERDDDGRLGWNSGGLPFEEIGQRIAHDGGRWAMILDYALVPGAKDTKAAFRALDDVAHEADIAVEGCYEPRDGSPGRAYLAPPREMDVDAALAILRDADLPLVLTLVHPVDEDESPSTLH
jgi:hypothetical protein